MPKATTPRRSRPKQTSAAGGDRAAAVGVQLAQSFHALIDAFPSQARTVSQMSRWLEVPRPNCQRIMLGLRAAEDPMEVLQRFPGARGLSQFVAAARARGVGRVLLDAAERAVVAYADLINDYGGTQSKLTARLTSLTGDEPAKPAQPVNDPELKRTGFEFAAAMTGYRCAVRTEITIARVMTDNPGKLEVVTASGLIGANRLPHGMPICRMYRSVGQSPHVSRTATLSGSTVVGLSPHTPMEGFSTPDIPVVSRRLDDDWIIEVFNEEGNDRPVDLVVGNHMAPATEHPATTDCKVYNRGIVVAVPAERLILDVYLERPLAQASVVTSGCYFTGLIGGVGPNRPERRWFDLLPESPPIELLGSGLRKSASPYYHRQADLAAYLFGTAGWNPDRFVGFRCSIPYPAWGVEHLMTFDFAQDTRSEPPTR